jgi:hypothetical protein
VSELASGKADRTRFETRRGLPVLRENWTAPKTASPERSHDRDTIDHILTSGRFVCNFWIKNYWAVESQLQGSMREIFIGVPIKCGLTDAYLAEKVSPTAGELQDRILKQLGELGDQPTNA